MKRKKGANGGDEGDRTPDLLTASQALSQLSYAPLQRENTIRERRMKCKHYLKIIRDSFFKNLLQSLRAPCRQSSSSKARAIGSGVEHILHTDGVTSSILASPTINLCGQGCCASGLLLYIESLHASTLRVTFRVEFQKVCPAGRPTA